LAAYLNLPTEIFVDFVLPYIAVDSAQAARLVCKTWRNLVLLPLCVLDPKHIAGIDASRLLRVYRAIDMQLLMKSANTLALLEGLRDPRCRVRRISFGPSVFQTNAIEQLADALFVNTSLRLIQWNVCDILPSQMYQRNASRRALHESCVAFGKSLRNNERIKYIVLQSYASNAALDPAAGLRSAAASRFVNLRAFLLQGFELNSDGARVFAKFIASAHSLTSLTLRSCIVSDAAANALCLGLQRSKILRKLTFEKVLLSGASTESICNGVKGLPILEEISLGMVNIGDHLGAVNDLLSHNSSLISLRAVFYGASLEEYYAYCRAVGAHPKIRSAWFGTILNIQFAQVMNQVLLQTQSLTRIELELLHDTIEPLVEGIASNKSIKALNLGTSRMNHVI
jgi:hypothetical protein